MQTDIAQQTFEFLFKVMGDVAGFNTVLMASVGDRVGLFKALDASGAVTSSELADKTGGRTIRA